jgi:hypothetical protein
MFSVLNLIFSMVKIFYIVLFYKNNYIYLKVILKTILDLFDLTEFEDERSRIN